MTYGFKHFTDKTLSAGEPVLGATIKEGGVNFAVASRDAREIFLLLFDRFDGEPADTIRLTAKTGDIWHGFVAGIKAGQIYGYRAAGKYDPGQGLCFNPCKILLDPYAKAITPYAASRRKTPFACDSAPSRKTPAACRRDNASCAYKAVVVDDRFNWGGDCKPRIAVGDMVIYETHLKGFTAHRSSKVRAPGTYAGFIEKIPYLKKLGVTTVELLPVQSYHRRRALIEKGVSEYWGYNTIGFFAPEFFYSSRKDFLAPVREFKTLVKALHRAGLEIILDVVYNHTGELGAKGPILSLKGLDNPRYYCLRAGAQGPRSEYVNDTGCGNTINISDPICRRMVVDSLVYWVKTMHVDGFRFDLASVLGRESGAFSFSAAFFKEVAQAPELKNIKLIAEPWDLAGYELGHFPAGWMEWNDKFRDSIRRFVRGDRGEAAQLATRLAGSEDIFSARGPLAGVNFVTCHDGFTLNDLVSYNKKHNIENREHNRDGAVENNSFNYGAEGPAKQPAILRARRRAAKNALCLLFLSQGVPMMLGGDEFLRTQKGNNNAYCQDNAISWHDWRRLKKNKDIFIFVKHLIAIRRAYGALRRKSFFKGRLSAADSRYDIKWFNDALRIPDWHDFQSRLLCGMIDSAAAGDPQNYLLFFIFNAAARPYDVKIPEKDNALWRRLIDTALPPGKDAASCGKEPVLRDQSVYPAAAGSCVLLIGK